MADIKQVKSKRSKSHGAIVAMAQALCAEVRDNQYKAIGFVLVGKDTDVTNFFIVPGTEISSLSEALDDLRTEVKNTKYED